MQDNGKYKIYRGLITAGRWVLFAIVAFIILFSHILDFYFVNYPIRGNCLNLPLTICRIILPWKAILF